MQMRNQIFVGDQGGKVHIVAFRNRDTGKIVFPMPQGAGAADHEPVELPSSGTLWTYTIQRIPPKDPPFEGINSPEGYQPFAVGYVRLGDEIMIEGRIAGHAEALQIGMSMDCVPMSFPTKDGAEMTIYAFVPANGSSKS
ncbi:DNA-binding protein [Sphingomonas sp. ID1715]|uniref:Zn-ribbon domain-containing OB-fold protein n=1 Tax=Sphingomonas sp. ID1715 TaxID=1656898 RepID=UPI001487BF7F|nr:OB-fold domain-containing protein [Sphingomonas sp. ID1715]NNM78083.1 DNA-binding protein [Sphingomonas sp. ID1715]